MWKVFFSLLIGTACNLAVTQPVPAQVKDNSYTVYKYVVWGASTKNPKPHAWTNYYDSRAQAQKRLREIEYDHSRGLLKSSTDKPVGLRVRSVPFKVTPPPPARREESYPELPHKSRKVPGVTSSSSSTNQSDSRAKPKSFWEASLEREWDALNSRKQDLDRRMEEINKMPSGLSRTIALEAYNADLKEYKKTLKAVQADQQRFDQSNRQPEPFSERLRNYEKKSKPQGSRTYRKPIVQSPVGGWQISGGTAYYQIRAGGTGSIARAKGTRAKRIRWSQQGDMITINGPVGALRARVNGNTLRFLNGSVNGDVFHRR